jgi:NAD(P)-dependent dehydrogenase (short-subunit alcohol dehydrogenase family)
MLGSRSDICEELSERFMRDGWMVNGWKRGGPLPLEPWDAIVVGIGVLDPIGRFFECEDDEWQQGVDSNVLLPLRLLRRLWKYRRPGASVCFFSGAGVAQPARTYSAYAASKIMLMSRIRNSSSSVPAW